MRQYLTEKLRSLRPLLAFHLVLNTIVVLFITGASYYHVPLEGFKDRAIYFLHLCALQSTVAGFLYFLSLYRWPFRIVFSALFLLYCCFSYWAYTQDISFTPALIQSVFETKPDIAADLITLPYLLFFLLAAATLGFILRWYSKIEPRQGFRILVLPALACVILYFGFEYKQYGIFKFRLPYNVIQAVEDYYDKPRMELLTDLPPVKRVNDSIKVVLVLGETVRADHLGLNGYERPTTPLLKARGDVISYVDLFTSNTYTGSSVPQILTDKDLKDSIRPYISVYSVAEASGYKTAWVGNQTLEKSYEPIVDTNEELILVDKYKSVLSFDKALDEVMLEPLDSLLSSSNNALVTLHMIGSHWYYENRYTEAFRKWTPVIDSKYIPSLTPEQLLNSYDNTILYLDSFLDKVIEKLEEEQTPTVMVYISDHGELLGEEGKWLHAQRHEALMNPAYLIWFSESYRINFPQRVRMFEERVNESFTTDVFFDDMLEILNTRILE